jgi:hypothetical protein
MGQFSGNVFYTYFYDDNPLRSSSGDKEFANIFKTDLNYRFFDRELYLTYTGNYNMFQTSSDRNYQFHSLGISSGFKIGDTEDENLFTGLNYNIKRGISDYISYDYNQVTAFLNGRFPLSETSFIQPSYNLNYKNFSALNDLIHLENYISVQFSTFFDTKTGIFLDAGLGNKYYSYDEETTRYVFSGTGHGRLQNNNPTVITNKSQRAYNVIQLKTMLKVSQSIFDNTGINAFYQHRFLLADGKGIYQSSDYVYSGDDELWDDPYGYSSNEYGTGLTQKLFSDITIKIGAQYSNRHYTNNIADTLNLTQRIDKRFELWAGISKTFNEVPVISSVDLMLEYMYVKNTSNTSLFAYKNNMAMLGIQFNF